MATTKVLLDTRRALKDGTFPLVVRVYNGSKFRDISLKTHLLEDDFDTIKQKVKSNHPNQKVINQRIKQAIIKVQSTALNLELTNEAVSADKIKHLIIKPQAKLDFMEFGWMKVDELAASNHYGNSCIYRDALNALITYSGKKSIAFKDLDFQFLKQVENKMLAAEVKVNTVALSLRTIRAIYNKAIKEKQIDKSYYPFDEFKIKHEATAKRNISKEDIAALLQLPLQPNTAAFNARNYFILSFNLRGISFADMASIKRIDIVNGRLIYKRKKTHKLYSIKLTEKAEEILQHYQQQGRRYILPVIPESAVDNPIEERKHIQYGTKTANKYLKRMGKDLKLPIELTSYVARHSFATIAKRLGYSKDLISEALGHSSGNRITEIYLGSYDQQVIDDMTEAVCKF